MRLPLLGVLTLVLACEGRVELPFDLERMLDQPRYDAYEHSDFFEDGRTMRPPPEGTVPRGDLPAPSVPPPVTAELLHRGRDRYGIYCSPCHGLLGTADTPVAASMPARPPPSLHEPRLLEKPPEHIQRVVERGYGFMPSYADRLDRRDRWAVAQYVKTLQMAAGFPLDALPPPLQQEARRALRGGAPAREGAP